MSVAGEHFVAERKAVKGHHERDAHLLAVGPMIARVTVGVTIRKTSLPNGFLVADAPSVRATLGTVVDSGDKEIVLCGGTATSWSPPELPWWWSPASALGGGGTTVSPLAALLDMPSSGHSTGVVTALASWPRRYGGGSGTTAVQ